MSVFFMILTAALMAGESKDLLEATQRGDLEAVRAFLKRGDAVDVPGRYSATPLMMATSNGDLEVVKALVEAGADLKRKDTYYNVDALGWAAMMEHNEIAVYLVSKGADPSFLVTRLVRIGDLENAEFLGKVLAAAVEPKDLAMSHLLARERKYEAFIAHFEKNRVPMPEPPAYQMPAERLAGFVGTYYLDDTEITVEVVDKALQFSASSWGFWLYPESNERLINLPDPKLSVSIEDMEDGKANLHYHYGDFKAPLTREKPAAAATTAAKGDGPDGHLPAAAKVDMNPKIFEKAPARDWGSFRGIGARGVADGQNPPLTFDVPKGINLRWQLPLEGLGHGSPVVHDGKIFITTAVSKGNNELRTGLFGDVNPVEDANVHQWRVICVNAADGKILWSKTAHEGVPRVKRHSKATQANCTAAVNGDRLIVHFGAEGLYCYDHQGNLIWKKDLGYLDAGWFFNPEFHWGHASSPIIYKDTVIVQCDKQKDSYIAALSLENGKEVWRTARDEIPSWGTPTVVETSAGAQLVTNATKAVRAYDPKNGRQLWQIRDNSEITVPTPFAVDDLIYVTSGYRSPRPFYAVRPSARGDLTPADGEESPHLAWHQPNIGPYMPTPIVYNGLLHVVTNNGVISCYDAKTGERHYRTRLGGGGFAFTASPVAADGKIYFFSEEGDVFVLDASKSYNLLATNQVGEAVLATPAIYDGMLLVRTRQGLTALGEKPTAP